MAKASVLLATLVFVLCVVPSARGCDPVSPESGDAPGGNCQDSGCSSTCSGGGGFFPSLQSVLAPRAPRICCAQMLRSTQGDFVADVLLHRTAILGESPIGNNRCSTSSFHLSEYITKSSLATGQPALGRTI